MAIFLPGTAIGAISGDVGAINFVNRSGSLVARKKRRPTRLPAEAVDTSQSRLATAAAAWKNLSTEERAAWDNFATLSPSSNRLGVSRSISGYNAFVRQALYTLLAEENILTNPPVAKETVLVNNFIITSTLLVGQIIDFDTETPGTLHSAFVYGRNLFRDTTPTQNNSWKFLEFITQTTSAWDVSVNWASIIGLPQLNQIVAVRIIMSDKTVPSSIGPIIIFGKTQPE